MTLDIEEHELEDAETAGAEYCARPNDEQRRTRSFHDAADLLLAGEFCTSVRFDRRQRGLVVDRARFYATEDGGRADHHKAIDAGADRLFSRCGFH